MIPVDAVLVDFDGTACSHDVAEHLLIEFGDPSWPEWDEAVDRGEVPLREAILAQNALLGADRDTMLAFALEHCPLDPTFAVVLRVAHRPGHPRRDRLRRVRVLHRADPGGGRPRVT